MTSAHWTDRLSEYMDGELGDGEREALELHLLECPECAETLAELRDVVARATALEDRAPARDLWPGIAGRLAPREGHRAGADSDRGGAETPVALPLTPRRRPAFDRRRVALTVPQLLAAGIALVVLSAGGAWVALSPGAADATAGTPADGRIVGAAPSGPGAGVTTEVVPVTFSAAYVTAVSELETAFEEQRELLDPETIRVVERNLAIIDAAIAEARAALEEDPASGFLNTHLANAMRRKVDLLRQATRIERTEI